MSMVLRHLSASSSQSISLSLPSWQCCLLTSCISAAIATLDNTLNNFADQLTAAEDSLLQLLCLTQVHLCAGEFGELLVGGAGGPLLSRENPEQAAASSAADVVALLERVLHRPQLHAIAREYVLTALVKLSTRFADQTARIQVRIESTS